MFLEVKFVVDFIGESGLDSFDLDKKRKCKVLKKVFEVFKKKVRKNLILELFKFEGIVCFDMIVLVKCGK